MRPHLRKRVGTAVEKALEFSLLWYQRQKLSNEREVANKLGPGAQTDTPFYLILVPHAAIMRTRRVHSSAAVQE